jgi:hypothetical protein
MSHVIPLCIRAFYFVLSYWPCAKINGYERKKPLPHSNSSKIVHCKKNFRLILTSNAYYNYNSTMYLQDENLTLLLLITVWDLVMLVRVEEVGEWN